MAYSLSFSNDQSIDLVIPVISRDSILGKISGISGRICNCLTNENVTYCVEDETLRMISKIEKLKLNACINAKSPKIKFLVLSNKSANKENCEHIGISVTRINEQVTFLSVGNITCSLNNGVDSLYVSTCLENHEENN